MLSGKKVEILVNEIDAKIIVEIVSCIKTGGTD